tara:strand:+ start:62 stop:1174 length:1113 start_codon:yes stop_codon:yes gene_type:complete
MNSKKAEKKQTEISIIGCGIAGITTAFHLGKKGYKVNLIDPKVNSEINNLRPKNGTQASLGVLMGNIYKKSKGRAFLLRNKSMKLWQEWLTQINYSESNFIFKKPLIKLANSQKEYQSMIELINNKKKYKIELLDKNSLNFWNSIFETKLIGGLISHEDGRLNPTYLIKSFMQSLDQIKINKIAQNVIKISKNNNLYSKKWNINLENNQCINQDYIVICSALNTQKLLKPLGHEILLEPILGQVIELELNKKNVDWREWPAILNYQSLNFILHKPNHMLVGATIERGIKASIKDKQKMLNLNSTAPKWMTNARISHEWSGIRARPMREPAPLLKHLETGLLINTGHYRNGILLAPACAEWVGHQIERNKY